MVLSRLAPGEIAPAPDRVCQQCAAGRKRAARADARRRRRWTSHRPARSALLPLRHLHLLPPFPHQHAAAARIALARGEALDAVGAEMAEGLAQLAPGN